MITVISDEDPHRHLLHQAARRWSATWPRRWPRAGAAASSWPRHVGRRRRFLSRASHLVPVDKRLGEDVSRGSCATPPPWPRLRAAGPPTSTTPETCLSAPLLALRGEAGRTPCACGPSTTSMTSPTRSCRTASGVDRGRRPPDLRGPPLGGRDPPRPRRRCRCHPQRRGRGAIRGLRALDRTAAGVRLGWADRPPWWRDRRHRAAQGPDAARGVRPPPRRPQAPAAASWRSPAARRCSTTPTTAAWRTTRPAWACGVARGRAVDPEADVQVLGPLPTT